MYVLTQVSILDAFLLFFATLGPLKAADPFAQATRGADSSARRTMAWRATAIATVMVIGVALFSSVILEHWRVSVAALVVSGSIILLCQSVRMIVEMPSSTPASLQPQDPGPGPLSSALACFPIAVPALVTAPGIVAIVVFMAIAGDDWRQMGIVLGTLLAIMTLNLAALLNARAFKRTPSSLTKAAGWVMAVLQAVEAVQYLLNGLVRAGVLHPFYP
jgi:multiple antibiotic resistance protein